MIYLIYVLHDLGIFDMKNMDYLDSQQFWMNIISLLKAKMVVYVIIGSFS